MSMQLSKETTEESIRVFLDQIKMLHGPIVSRDMQIEWLQKENMRLRELLQPFVCRCADGWCTEYIKPINEAKAGCEHYKARAALGEKE